MTRTAGWSALVLVAACRAGEGGATGAPGSTDLGPTTPTGVTTGTTPTGVTTGSTITSAAASCVQDLDNVLRYVCSVTVDPPQPVDLDYWPVDGSDPVRTWSSEAVANQHEIVVYMMKPETEYAWSARPRFDNAGAIGGSWTTGALSGGCDVDVTVTGTSSSPYFVAQSPCVSGTSVIAFDGAGQIYWCERFQPVVGGYPPVIEGTSLTEDDTVITVVADTVIEKDFLGNELLRLSRGVDFDAHVHHDVFRKDGRTLILFNEVVNWNASTYTLDGFYVFEQGVQVGEWHLFDWFQPPFPALGYLGQDYSHGNSIWQDDDGSVLVGFRHLSAIAKVVGDPADPDFGTVIWRMAGDAENQQFGNDFAIGSQVAGFDDFERQHNAHFLPNGRLTVFDNRDFLHVPIQNSRLIELDVDEVGFTADIVAEYEVPVHCDFQGGAWHTTVGNPVATCAPSRTAYEWDVGVPDAPRWTGQVACGQLGADIYVPRFIPWDGPW